MMDNKLKQAVDELRKVDYLIAEKIMGFSAEWSHSDSYGKVFSTEIGPMHIAETPHYTESMDDAFSVVEELQKRGYLLSLTYKTCCFVNDLDAFGWEAIFRGGRGLHCVSAAKSPAEAICQAALLVAKYLEE